MSEQVERTYAEAINDALSLAMEADPNIMIMGQLVDTQAGIFDMTTGLVERFGKERVLDFPVAESLMTSAAIGLSLEGKIPILFHQRFDFALYSFDAIINWLGLWFFKTGGLQSPHGIPESAG